jgi:hypothetical protein
MAYTHHADIIVSCPQEEIQNIIQQVFYYNGFTLEWHSPVEGMAHHGSRTGNFLLYPYVQYYEIVFQIFPMANKSSVIRLIKSFRGSHWGKGRWLDYTLIEKKFMEIVNIMSSHFYSMGWLENTMFF